MLTEDQIQFLNRVCSDKWTEENGVINVNGDVKMSEMRLKYIPVQFGRIRGDFTCFYNGLTNLIGAPFKVSGYFSCQANSITSLEGGPKEVGSSYSCRHNYLTNLIGAPEVCNTHFDCFNNKLTSLEGCPKLIKTDLNCVNSNLKYLFGINQIIGKIYYISINKYYEIINKWIIESAKKDIFFPFYTLEENINWIKQEQKYSCLLGAPDEIREYFSPRILHLLDNGFYNKPKLIKE